MCNKINGFKKSGEEKIQKNELKISLSLLRGMVPDYPSTELRQSSEKTKQEKIRIPLSNFF